MARLHLDLDVKCVQCQRCGGNANGMILSRLWLDSDPPVMLIEQPAEALSGPWVSFQLPSGEYRVVKSIMPAEELRLMGEKHGPTRHRVKFMYSGGKFEGSPIFLVLTLETVLSRDSPFLSCILEVKNFSAFPLADVSLVWVVDFNVGGVAGRTTNRVELLDQKDAGRDKQVEIFGIVQKNGDGAFAGVVSQVVPYRITGFSPSTFDLSPAYPHVEKKLLEDLQDCGVALEWNVAQLDPRESFILPILIFGGTSGTNPLQTARDGWQKASRALSRYCRIDARINPPKK